MLLTAARVLIAVLLVGSFFMQLYENINGRPAKDPAGFSGVVTTIIVHGLVIALWWSAGAFHGWFQ